MHCIVLHIGSNQGWRNQQLLQARRLLSKQLGEELKVSAVYETSAWGIEEQPDFLNQACLFRTKHSPHEVLTIALAVEQQLGRQRLQRWGQRVIDIDLIFYDQQIVDSPTLTIPHPWLQERRFVLAPLAEIIPDWEHPTLGKTVAVLLEACNDQGTVVKVNG